MWMSKSDLLASNYFARVYRFLSSPVSPSSKIFLLLLFLSLISCFKLSYLFLYNMLSSVYFFKSQCNLCEKRNSYIKIILFYNYCHECALCLEKFKKKGECFVQSSLRETPLSPHVPQNKAHSYFVHICSKIPFLFVSLFPNSCFTHLRELGKGNMYIQYSGFFVFYVSSPLVLCNSFFYNLCNLFNNYKLWFYFWPIILPLNLRSFLSIFQGETLDFNICPVIDFLPP